MLAVLTVALGQITNNQTTQAQSQTGQAPNTALRSVPAGSKMKFKQSKPLALTSTSNISEMMLSMMLDDLPDTYLDTIDDRLSSVTIADVRRVAERILTPDELVTVLVGNPEGIPPTKTVETLPNVK